MNISRNIVVEAIGLASTANALYTSYYSKHLRTNGLINVAEIECTPKDAEWESVAQAEGNLWKYVCGLSYDEIMQLISLMQLGCDNATSHKSHALLQEYNNKLKHAKQTFPDKGEHADAIEYLISKESLDKYLQKSLELVPMAMD